MARCPTRAVALALLAVVAAAPAAAQRGGLYAGAPTSARTNDVDASPWLERLERDVRSLGPDSRGAHWAAVANAFLLAGDASGALQVASEADPRGLAGWLRAKVDGCIAARDTAAVVALCHVLDRMPESAQGELRAELVRALCLIGRTDWARRRAAAEELVLCAAWSLEGRIRAGASEDTLSAIAELRELDSRTADALLSVAARRALAAGRLDEALDLFASCAELAAEDRASIAIELWRNGRREEALERVDPSSHGAAAAVHLAAQVDLPSDVLAGLAAALARNDLAGRVALGRAESHALALEGRCEDALRTALQVGTLTSMDRFRLALDLERGGDRSRATKLATSDPWSEALLALWRASRQRGDADAALARARELVGSAHERAVELAALALECGHGERAGALAVEALGENPLALSPSALRESVRVDLAAAGGANLVRLHDGLASSAARTVLAAAVVEALLESSTAP